MCTADVMTCTKQRKAQNANRILGLRAKLLYYSHCEVKTVVYIGRNPNAKRRHGAGGVSG